MVEAHDSVRVRIAPSPTGPITLGTARTALFNWLFARAHSGIFVVRIEDTDRERSEKRYEDQIFEGLRWLGLMWDEGPDMVGKFGPYRQSERTPLYKKYLEQLLDEGKAYYCYCTKEELEAERQAMVVEGLPPKYSGHCRSLSPPPAHKKPQAIRFKTPEARVEFKDMIRGALSFDAALFGDMVIAKSLDQVLYNFAVVVDDYAMQISHVIRGEDHISNTPKQLLLMKALGFKEPLYAHLPLLLGPDRSKLSKRTAEASFLSYKDEGYLPEAMINFLAFLGWHPKGNEEILSSSELIKEFDIRRVQKAGAICNFEKLNWFNSQHVRRMSIPELLQKLQPILEANHIVSDESFLLKVLTLERERMTTLTDFILNAQFYFELPPYAAQLLIWNSEPIHKIQSVLKAVLHTIQSLEYITAEKMRVALEPLIASEGRGVVLWPLRVALSGQAASPDPILISEVLGKEETIRRLEIAITKSNAL